jgi:hypothetical protein
MLMRSAVPPIIWPVISARKKKPGKSVVAMALAYLIALHVFVAGHASAVSGKIVHAAIRP